MAAQQSPHNVAVFNYIKDYAQPSEGAAIANALGLNGVKLAKASEGGLSTAQVLKDLGYLNMHPRAKAQRERLLQAFKDAEALVGVLPQIEDELDPPAQQPAAPQPAEAWFSQVAFDTVAKYLANGAALAAKLGLTGQDSGEVSRGGFEAATRLRDLGYLTKGAANAVHLTTVVPGVAGLAPFSRTFDNELK